MKNAFQKALKNHLKIGQKAHAENNTPKSVFEDVFGPPKPCQNQSGSAGKITKKNNRKKDPKQTQTIVSIISVVPKAPAPIYI